jgi:acetolactate synthase-1/2/3 large subunit
VVEAAEGTVAEALLRRLKAVGVDYLFANGGTDFAPIIEAIARNGAGADAVLPRPLVMAHETAAVAMAHGAFLATGQPQAVMVHTNVGLANAVMGAINAAAENIPILLFSGRTPITETGRPGSRSSPINWGQEMRDQSAMVRECVKWEFELRYGDQVGDLVDRALAVATSAPQGPVYMSLPREVLCEPMALDGLSGPPRQSPASGAPRAADLEAAAELLAGARRPLVIAQRGSEAGFHGLARFAERFALPVVEFWPSRSSLTSDSAMHAGFDPAPWLERADVVLVLDALVPWIPERHEVPADCKVIQAGPDPLFARHPVRGFPADVVLTGEVAAVLEALTPLLASRLDGQDEAVAARGRTIGARTTADRAARRATALAGATAPMSPAWVSHCLSQALGADGIVVSELGCDPAHMSLTGPGRYFCHALSGGLGWALPAALGVKLAKPDAVVAAAVGDGSYLFANPAACHQIAEAHDLPILTVVFNNGLWNAVRRSTLEIYPEGHAARANVMPITSLRPAPDYTLYAKASRGWAQGVERGADLPAALEQAITVVREQKRQALLDVAVAAE